MFWRLIGGLAIGTASVIAPAYIAEIAPAHLRGRLGSLQQLAIVTGIFIALLTGYVIAHAAAFVAGFTLLFALAGASAGFLGDLASGQGDWLARAGGVVMMVLGMQMSGLIHIPYLDRTYQVGA